MDEGLLRWRNIQGSRFQNMVINNHILWHDYYRFQNMAINNHMFMARLLNGGKLDRVRKWIKCIVMSCINITHGQICSNSNMFHIFKIFMLEMVKSNILVAYAFKYFKSKFYTACLYGITMQF